MDCLSRLLRAAMRRCPRLRRSRHWWFRPVHEVLTMAVRVLALAWLIQPESPVADIAASSHTNAQKD